MNEKIVTSQAELDAVPVDFAGRIVIKFGTPYNRAVVNRKFKHPVWLRDLSSAELWDSSSAA